ncbi:MAG: GNAT family N-acetyltransferase [Woeseiaceae bacterium]|nr:GNAT family N-acetyltransferase [Woeseiaceae bacterium]
MSAQPRYEEDGWTLAPSPDSDREALMGWFGSADDVSRWGGPKFRYPFTPESFAEDCRWGEIASFSLLDPDDDLAAFGQIYERLGRINLARLVVHPARRGAGVGARLVRMLMTAGRDAMGLDEFSLFVYRDNAPALACYRAAGFAIRPYPADQPLADVCHYLTRPVRFAAE